MRQSDTLQIGDLLTALRLLSRLPLPVDMTPPRAMSAWAWPLAGAGLAALVALVGMLGLGLGAGVAAALALGAQAMLTGAMHEDGLADTFDGLWGGWDKARRLAIMKDSHIGTYGVMALIVVSLIRWTALTGLLAGGHWGVIIVIGAVSRVPMAMLMAMLPNARGTGLSQSVGRVPMPAAWLAVAVGVGFALCLGPAGLSVVLSVVVVSTALALVAKAKIGGQTGDILGASQQLSEAAALSIIVALL
jgi:adenosylcobinamide-GDP ribazoletransferase